MTRLRELRLKKGFSQEEMATRAGMTQSNYHKLEANKSALKATHILKFCDILECTPNDLLGVTDKYQKVMSKLDV